MHGYWQQVFKEKRFGTSHTLGPDTARMGLELATIPVMSTEAETIFSGSKLTIATSDHDLAMISLRRLSA